MQEFKPRARPYKPSNPCIAWMCFGYKSRLYHVRFGNTWWEACQEWHETKPHEVKFQPDIDYLDDLPF